MYAVSCLGGLRPVLFVLKENTRSTIKQPRCLHEEKSNDPETDL